MAMEGGRPRPPRGMWRVARGDTRPPREKGSCRSPGDRPSDRSKWPGKAESARRPIGKRRRYNWLKTAN
jgi:hypothetical protein